MTVSPDLAAAKAAELQDLHDRYKSWRKVAALYPPIVKPGTLCRIVKSQGAYLPDDRKILWALGLIERRKRSEIEERISRMAKETRKALVMK